MVGSERKLFCVCVMVSQVGAATEETPERLRKTKFIILTVPRDRRQGHTGKTPERPGGKRQGQEESQAKRGSPQMRQENPSTRGTDHEGAEGQVGPSVHA